jgi:hypothetical protein
MAALRAELDAFWTGELDQIVQDALAITQRNRRQGGD